MDWASRIVGKKIYRFCFVLLGIWGQFSKYKPPVGLYLEGRFNRGFFALPVWGAYIWKCLFSEFYGNYSNCYSLCHRLNLTSVTSVKQHWYPCSRPPTDSTNYWKNIPGRSPEQGFGAVSQTDLITKVKFSLWFRLQLLWLSLHWRHLRACLGIFLIWGALKREFLCI